MNSRHKKKTNYIYYILIAVLLVGFCMVGYAGYQDSLKQVIYNNTLDVMEENGRQDVKSLTCRLQSAWDYLYNFQKRMSGDSFSKEEKSPFDELWVLDESKNAWKENGELFNYSDTSWGSLIEKQPDGFVKVVPGQDGEEEIVCGIAGALSEPWKESKRVGIAGRLSRKWLEACVEWNGFEGSGKSAVIDENGTYILGYKLPEVKGMITSIDMNKRIFTQVTYQGEEYFIYLHPLENTGWYLATSVPAAAVNSQTNLFAVRSIVFFGIMVLVILVLFIYVMREHQKMKLAVESERAKTIFLSNMSHEIRTPLNGIIGLLYLLKQNAGDREASKEYLDKMETSAEFLRDIVTSILDMSKIESGQMELFEKSVDLWNTVNEVGQIIQGQAVEKNIDFTINYDLTERFVLADSFRVKQILVNLLGNAVKFTSEGGWVKLTVNQKKVDDTKFITNFIISDNGCGMSEEFQQIIWRPFEQEHREYSQNGTGLGTTLSKALTERMGGTISLASKIGKGTVVTVQIPFKIPVQKEMLCTKKKESSNRQRLLETGQILVADDNDINREVLSTILREKDYQVDEVSNGKEAVEAFEKSKAGFYKIILMDIQMPILNGYEAAEKIRRLKRSDARTVKIIAVTANAFSEDVEMAEKAGMDEVVTKPVDIERLISVINERRDERKDG